MNLKVKIVKLIQNDGKLKAIAKVTIEESFAVNGIRIVESEKGLFVSMPCYKSGEEFKDIFYPVNADSRKQLVDAVILEYQQSVHMSKSSNTDPP